MLKPIVEFRNPVRRRTDDRMPGQTLKRKKYVFASLILICVGFDWLLLWFCRDAFFMLLCDAPYLPAKYAQEYTHLKTLHIPPSMIDERYSQAMITSMTFSADNEMLAAGHGESLHFWAVETGDHQSVLKTDHGAVGGVAFSPDGKTIASVSGPYRASDHLLLKLHDILSLAYREKQDYFSPFLQELFMDYTVEMWDVKTGEKRLTFPAETLLLSAVEFSPDGRKFHLTTLACTLEVYDTTTGKHLEKSISVGAHNAIENTYAARSFAFSPDAKIFASGGSDPVQRSTDVADAEIQLWDLHTGLRLQTLKSPGGRIQRLAFSPDSKTLASAGDNPCGYHLSPNKIYIYDVENPRLLCIIDTGSVGERRIQALRFSPDNVTLASGHTGGRIHLWDLTGQTHLK